MKNLIKAGLSFLCLSGASNFTAHANHGYRQVSNAHYDIQLFSGRYHSGQLVSVRTDINRLDHIGFNDRARSLAVRGTWEVCEHANFVGRCIIVLDDILDLGEYGLANELTAVRPIYKADHVPHGFVFVRDKRGNIHEPARYYANYGRNNRYSDYYPRYSWHPLHIEIFAGYGYYNPSFGYGSYGFAHPRYRRIGYRGYSDYFRHRHNRAHTKYPRIYANHVGRPTHNQNTGRYNRRDRNVFEAIVDKSRANHRRDRRDARRDTPESTPKNRRDRDYVFPNQPVYDQRRINNGRIKESVNANRATNRGQGILADIAARSNRIEGRQERRVRQERDQRQESGRTARNDNANARNIRNDAPGRENRNNRGNRDQSARNRRNKDYQYPSRRGRGFHNQGELK